MSSDLERLITRDLDQLPLLPADRWIPVRRTARGAGAQLAVRAIAVVAVLTLAVLIGTGLARTRSPIPEDRAAAPSGSVAGARATAGPPAGRIGRQDAMARVRGLTVVLPRIDRIEAKLVSRPALGSVDPSLASAPGWTGAIAWVVAVSGDVRCSYCLTAVPPMRSGLFLLDATTGLAFTTTASGEAWPARFDALPDESIARGSINALGHVVDVRGPDEIVLLTDFPAGPGTRLTLRADADTTFAWSAGDLGGTAASIAELAQLGQLVAGGSSVAAVTYDPRPAPDGSYRLEHVLTGALTR